MKIEFGKASGLRPVELPELDKGASLEGDKGGFEAAIKSAISQASETAKTADADAEGLVRGDVDIHEAMVSMQKADLVLRLGTTVRNKLLDAYRQLSQTGG